MNLFCTTEYPVLKAMKTQVPDKDGNMGKYKKADFKYDVAAGFITF